MASLVLISFWVLAALLIVFAGILTTLKSNLPQSFNDLLFYGKLRGKRTKWSMVQSLEIPKSWFSYFYITGAVINGVSFVLVLEAYLNHRPLPYLLRSVLQMLTSSEEISTDALAAVLIIGMMFMQNVRRLLECFLISVYSKSTMNIFHFALGIILYSTFFMAVLVEAPVTSDASVSLRLRWNHIFGLLLFAWASWHHHQSHVTLAQLRKNKTGSVVNYEHAIPCGGWFEYISCPHFFMEILIYIAFVVVGGFGHKTLLSICFFVLCNQLVASHLTHSWYRGQFRNYPSQRTAVIPFIF